MDEPLSAFIRRVNGDPAEQEGIAEAVEELQDRLYGAEAKLNDEVATKGRRAKIHSAPVVPIAWCRFGIVLGPYIFIWWGTWGDFLATMRLKHDFSRKIDDPEEPARRPRRAA